MDFQTRECTVVVGLHPFFKKCLNGLPPEFSAAWSYGVRSEAPAGPEAQNPGRMSPFLTHSESCTRK